MYYTYVVEDPPPACCQGGVNEYFNRVWVFTVRPALLLWFAFL